MRAAIVLILVTLSLLVGNIIAGNSNSNAWIGLMMVLSCFLNAVVIAGIVSTCPMRSSWIAYIITTSLFMLLVVTRSEGLSATMQQVAELVNGWGVLPRENSSLNFFPVDRLRAALETSSPPLFGIAAGWVAILCFPGKRFRKENVHEYKDLALIHFHTDRVPKRR